MKKHASFRELAAPHMEVNVSEEERIKQLKWNVKRPLPQLKIGQPQYEHPGVALVLGGPSINDYVDEIRGLREVGWGLATVNGSYRWALMNGMVPSIQVMLDGRTFNRKFVKEKETYTQFFVCSHAHPALFDELEGYDVHMFHCPGSKEAAKVINEHFFGMWAPLKGGTTVGLRAIYLLHMLGSRRVSIYGMDSCYSNGHHHAYPQRENDAKRYWVVRCGGRKFKTTPWMASQAEEFVQMQATAPEDLELAVHGDGLIAHWIRETHRRKKPVFPTLVGQYSD